MELKTLINDEEQAVSPVIGVILMVAITVILAAVIGTFVLGLGDQVQSTSPNANFAFDWDSNNEELDISHSGGDGIAATELVMRGDVDVYESGTAQNDEANWTTDAATFGHSASDPVTAGDSVTIYGSASTDDPTGGTGDRYYGFADDDDGTDSSVRLVWESSDSDQSSTLRSWSAD